MYRDIDAEELLQKITDIPLVDLRSPAEYNQATIPGAYNIPLLDTIERALVGIAYQRQGPAKAREIALDLVAPKLPVLMQSFKKLAVHKEIIIFCWRGGDRSHFAGFLLDAMGYKVYRLKGGYKAFRKNEFQYLNQDTLPLRAVVLHGLTGVGKTELLRELQKQGCPVLDLEGLARHRGSVFGKIGQPPSPSQKMFESLVARELRRAQNCGFFVVECESKKLGNLYVPGVVMQTMARGYNILLYASINSRIRRIKRDYINGEDQDLCPLQMAINRLGKYIGFKKVEELNQFLKQGEIDKVINFLLRNYYDPLYKYPDEPSKSYHLSLDNNDVEQSVPLMMDFIINTGLTTLGGEKWCPSVRNCGKPEKN